MIIVVRIAETVNEYLEAFFAKRPKLKVLCPDCGGKTQGHGSYVRRLKDKLSGPVVKVRIYRVKCTVCHKTASLLPHFVRPYSPYSLFSHERAFRLYAGSQELSLEEVAEEVDLEPRTLQNWVSVFTGFYSQVTSRLARRILEISPGAVLRPKACHSSRERLQEFFRLAERFLECLSEPVTFVFPMVHLAYPNPFLPR